MVSHVSNKVIGFSGISLGYAEAGVQSDRIYNNTIIGGNTTGSAIFIPTNGGGKETDTVIIKNNIIVQDSGSRSYMSFCGMSTYTYKDIDYNNYWSHNPSDYAYMVDSTSHGITWTAWKAKGFDAHSDTGRVTFQNIWGTNATDYRLSSGSAGIDDGTDLSAYFTTDILGTVRPRNAIWDKGAFEFY